MSHAVMIHLIVVEHMKQWMKIA